jgi:adenine-specific DNA-methyltransferase
MAVAKISIMINLLDLKSLIGKPVYEDENALIYHGDSIELINRLPDRCIPLTITSPPYNIGKEYEKILSLESYTLWMNKWIEEVYRCTTSEGAFWLNVGYLAIPNKGKAVPITYLIWDQVPFYLIQEIVWNYAAGVAGKLFFSPRNEKLLWYVKDPNNYIFNLDDIRDPNVKYPNQKKNGKLKCNPKGKNPTDVWQIAKVTSGKNRSSQERTEHPAQFPINLVTRIILASSNLGDIVFDPFLGSGSTAEAAILKKRKVIGFEINDRYIEIAIKRIENLKKRGESIQEQKNIFDLLINSP